MSDADNERAKMRRDLANLRGECLATGNATRLYHVDGFAAAMEAVLQCPALLQTTLEALRVALDVLAVDVKGASIVLTTPSEPTGEAVQKFGEIVGTAVPSLPAVWQASWILYNGARSDCRWVSSPSLPELCGQINAAEDEGDRDAKGVR